MKHYEHNIIQSVPYSHKNSTRSVLTADAAVTVLRNVSISGTFSEPFPMLKNDLQTQTKDSVTMGSMVTNETAPEPLLSQ